METQKNLSIAHLWFESFNAKKIRKIIIAL